ncbi:hypothetical protein CTI12_AA146440 [Artemisia annua]|uniref:KIB1-4 beta-propeller domain-containing protein n=1 Tax=Artemisia annua TaxID=35608 RepID=A0A2U1PKP3_ARTAN|nr:hypothetical protein CTI12_AA146440 [Artemisia annua]
MEGHKTTSACDQLLSSKYPLLVSQNLEAAKDDDQIIYTMHKPLSHFKCKIPELLGRRIRGCFHGWVVLSNHPYNVVWSLWNPITSNLIRLPTLTKKLGDTHECCLSSPPDDPCSVFFFTTTKKPTIIFCRLDSKRKKLRWIERSYAKQFRTMLNGKDGFLANPTCCNGKVYALTVAYYHYVVEVDILVKNNKVLISLSPVVEEPVCCFNRCPVYKYTTSNDYLKGSGTDLFFIAIAFEDHTRKIVAGLYLFKLDMTSMKWEEIKDLKDDIFFIELARNEDSVFYLPEIASELGGYVHILDEMGNVTCSYNIKRKTISLSSMPSVVLKREFPAWAMLECRLEGDPSDSKQEEKEYPVVIRSFTCDLVEFDRSPRESHLLNIPDHILEMIMELCVGVEYMNFRSTCKRCNLAAPHIQWSNKTMLRRLQTYSLVSPWLMVFDKHLGIITFTDPLLGHKYFINIPQELTGFQIYCSWHGWLLMYKIVGPIMVFFNPFTYDIRKLPVVGYLESFCFSAPPTSSDCMVVGFTTKGESNFYIHFVAGEPSWCTLGGGDDPSSFHFPTFCGQDVYVLRNDSGVDVYRKVGHEDYSWETFIAEAPRSCCTSPAKHFLAKCDQHLFLVVVGDSGESVEVFKVNESKKEWEKVRCLGTHMIYICATTCLCIEAKLPEMENKIYFPTLHSVDGKIVFYSLETCKYHTFNGKNIGETFVDFFGLECHSNPHTWIEPSWS